MFKTPVVLIIYNRPGLAEIVFEQIRKIKPEKLYIIADGPKDSIDVDKCNTTRNIVENVEWDCSLMKNYSDVNMGCRQRIISGLDWVFKKEEKAIILEDDCLPHTSFFPFCDELLEYYFDDYRIMHINGTNYGINGSDTDLDYYYSGNTYCHGWSTWKRAWKHFHTFDSMWPKVRDNDILLNQLTSTQEYVIRKSIWDDLYQGNIDSWAYQWLFASISQGGLAVTPNKNLVTNIGFGIDSTHTKDCKHWMSNLPTYEISLPLTHPEFIIRDLTADKTYFERNYKSNTSRSILYKKLKLPLKRLYNLFVSGSNSLNKST